MSVKVAERLATDEDVNLATLALELGYFDQAHSARDFRAITGRPPADYARTAASAPDPEAHPDIALLALPSGELRVGEAG